MADENNSLAEMLINIVNEVSQSSIDSASKTLVKNITARVESYDEETYKATVYFTDDNEKNLYTFYNSSASKLGTGDIVVIQYTNNRANGKLISKNGEPDPMGSNTGGVAPVISIQINSNGDFTINTSEGAERYVASFEV